MLDKPKAHTKAKRLALGMLILFICTHILVKAFIWFTASGKPHPQKAPHPIALFKGTARVKYRYTSAGRQRLFYQVDYLLAPVFIILFAMITVHLAKIPEIFEEKEWGG